MDERSPPARRVLFCRLLWEPRNLFELQAQFGDVWSQGQLERDFDIVRVECPFVDVVRKADGVSGSLMFQFAPRYYFLFKPDGEGKV